MDKKNMLENLKKHILEERMERIRQVASMRTRYLTVVLENVHYTQNISAIIRTCDCMGIQDLHIIGGSLSKINRHVALGASAWINCIKHRGKSTGESLAEIKKQGYRLVAAVPDKTAISLEDFDITGGPAAVIMGNEAEGVSPAAAEMAEERLSIPMRGFTDSFNVSVSAAIVLYELTKKLKNHENMGRLSKEEITDLEYSWVKKSLKRGGAVEEEYRTRNLHPNEQLK